MTDTAFVDHGRLAHNLLRMEEREGDIFRSHWHFDNSTGVNFGGQMFAQAMAAAIRTGAGRPVHSMSGTFLKPGLSNKPIDYHVIRLRDGRSFATRRVSAIQDGEIIFEALANLHAPEDGPEHQRNVRASMSAPEDLIDLAAFVEAKSLPGTRAKVTDFLKIWPFDLRLADNESLFEAANGESIDCDYWARIRPSAMASTGPGDEQGLFAFLSDFWFSRTALRHHGKFLDGAFRTSTLNHSLWFHAPFDMQDWLLFQVDSPVASDARGMTRGLIYDRAGILVASAVQELLIRPR